MGCVLTAGIAKTCDNLPNGGLRQQTVWLINLEDIASVTYDGTNANIITAITLKTSKTAFKFDGFGTSTKPAYRQVTGRGFGPTFEHEVGLQIFDLSYVGKDILPELSQSKVVAVVETNNDAQPLEVYGIGQGMLATSQEHIKTDAASGGTITVVLKTPEDGPAERKAPNDWLATDRATTLALIVALE